MPISSFSLLIELYDFGTPFYTCFKKLYRTAWRMYLMEAGQLGPLTNSAHTILAQLLTTV
jgi:hypothetical protein